MAKAEAEVAELVGMIQRGELRLPEMQRRYVWRSTRVRDLLDSLYRGYPSGAILLWESDDPIPQQEMAIAQEGNPFRTTRLLLDGQQRLTSLSAVLRGEPLLVRGRKLPIELLFNLEHPDRLEVVSEVDEEGVDEDEADEVDGDEADSTEDELLQRFNRMTFVISTKKLEQLPQWVKVTDVLKSEGDSAFLKRAGVTDLDDPRADKYTQRLAKLRAVKKYVYRLDVLDRSLSYDEVTEIFVRVNSLGAKLRSADLALAQITARWRGSLKVFQGFQEECEGEGFELDLGIHLKNLVVYGTGQSRFKTVGSLPLEVLKESWKAGVRGMQFAINFLRNNCGITSPVLLSSPFLMITLGYYGHHRRFHLTPEESVELARWALLANAKGRYSRGSSETILDQDLTVVKEGKSVADLLGRLQLQVGRLEITPLDLEGRTQRSALFKTMFLAFRAEGAKEWLSKVAIALDHSGSQHKLEFHHIFPKAQLKNRFPSREIDDIANLAFISAATNKFIRDKKPEAYFPEIVSRAGSEAFSTQCIPDDPTLLPLDQYPEFLNSRRAMIVARLNSFLGIAPSSSSGGV
ncbi:MAG: DUF262 domain-containing protein [Gemmatimonadales bacterium]